MRRSLASAMILCAIVFIIFMTDAMADRPVPIDAGTGVKCLEAVLQSQNIPISASELSRFAGKHGILSLQGIVSAAEKKRLHAAIVKIGFEDLATTTIPAIAMLNDGHFVIVSGGAQHPTITDFSRDRKDITADEFKNAYTGLAVLFGKAAIPVTKKNGSDIRCSWYVSDFGTVNSGDKVERTLKFRNVGNEDLVITYARPTCGCAVSSISSKRVAPDGTGEIKITLDTKGRQGFQDHKVYITSNDPVMPISQVRLVGMVISEKVALYPRSVDFGILRKDESICREVNVYDSGGYDLRVTKVACDSPYVNCSVATVGDERSPRYLLLLTLSPDVPQGDLKTKVTITTTHPKEPVVEVPVTATVKEDIGVPVIQMMFNTAKKGRAAQQSMVFFSSRKMPIKILKIGSPIPHMTTKATPMDGGKECRITMHLDKQAPVGQFMGDITLHTTDPGQPIIRIKVYGRVSD
jgi:hypothetical protein